MSTMLLGNRWFSVEATQDPNVRVYHTRLKLLSDFAVQGAMSNQQSKSEEQLGFKVAPILQLVLDIPGVAQAEVSAYKIVVVKAIVFSWEEIDNHLLGLMHGVKIADEAEMNEAPRHELVHKTKREN